MTAKRIAFVLLIVAYHYSHSQTIRIDEFGKPSEKEYELAEFPTEPDAAGIVLYESGNYYAVSIVRRNAVRLVKEIHRKIKVLDAKKFDFANIEIPYYVPSEYYGEEILDYKAVTHNGAIKNFVPKDAFYKIEKSGANKALRFTFPNVQNGSILEYRYTIVSPYFYDLNGWEFQNAFPTIYSLFQTSLPVNIQYNRILYGDKQLDISKTWIKKDGFLVPSNNWHIDTEVATYSMSNVPSFIEESHMLSRKNYVSKIVFEPLYFKAFHGFEHVFTRSWEDVDERFRNRNDFGKQLSEKGYFRRKMPKEILNIENDLDRAKAVYKFIQDTYTWNGRYFSYGQDVRNAFRDQKGNVTQINISLVNALEAAKLDAKPVILSTRSNGLPTEHYPVISNFNYVIVLLNVDGSDVLLDATNKQTPFGVLPFRTLNVKGRVMDFKKGSYWMPIEPFKQNIDYINSQISVDANGNFVGKVNQSNSGYIALGKRNSIAEKTLQEFVKSETNEKAGIEIENFELENISEIEQPLIANYDIFIKPEIVSDKTILHPFFTNTYISENPFKMEERSYPMDFGFPFINTYLVSIDLGNKYEIEHLPQSRTIKLQNDDAECSVIYSGENNKINIRFSLKLNAYRLPPDAYPYLKNFFTTVVTILKEEQIILKRK